MTGSPFSKIQLIPLCHGGSFIPADSRVLKRKWDASMRGDDNVQGQKSLPPNHFIDSPIGYRYSPKTDRDPVFFGRFFPGAARSCVAGPAGQPPRLISAVVTKLPISCN